MKILGILPESIGGRLTTSSILDGFRILGIDVFEYDKLNPCLVPNQEFDYIVSYDFTGIKYKKDNNLNIKTINYFSDEIRNKTSGPYWTEFIQELNNDDNYIFYWDRELCKQEKFKNLFYLPHFVNTDIYYDYKIQPQYDVMFAGRLDTNYRLHLIENLIDKCPNIKLCWYAIEKHFNDALARTKYPQKIKQIYHGFIDNEKRMADAINNSKIIINMNAQGISSLNYRTIQTIACGKLLISDNRTELDLFDNKIPTYNKPDEIPNLIDLFLKNNEQYEYITKYCKTICHKNHNSEIGVKYILSKL